MMAARSRLRFRLGAQVGKVDVALVVAADHDNLHAGHDERKPGWCRAPTTG